MRRFVWFLVVVLIVLHQDFWLWDDGRLVAGFMPIGLFYHVCLSCATAAVWLAATRYCWPDDLQSDRAGSIAARDDAISSSSAGGTHTP
ncbi:MAG: DUF3311 domain-containing protein [Planctomycetales bacterium]|nr:DUF3311 domain-containing protein [Planctomycetales bacterium]